MQSKSITRTVMAGMAVLVCSTGVAAQECTVRGGPGTSAAPPKVAAFTANSPYHKVMIFCDKAKAPACAVQFYCGSWNSRPTVTVPNPVTWDVSVEPGATFTYGPVTITTSYVNGILTRSGPPDPGSFVEALVNAGLSEAAAYGEGAYGEKTCVVRSNDPVEVFARQTSARRQWRGYRISPPEPYPCLSSNAKLSGLTISAEGTLAPAFDSDEDKYDFTTKASSVFLTPTAADSGASITFTPPQPDAGFSVPSSQPIEIKVAAEDGSPPQTYTIVLKRDTSR